jgi:hypothetical protein
MDKQMTNNKKVIELASQAAQMMVTDTRDDGSKFVKFNESRPQWMQDLAFSAHADMLPDDFRYQFISDALDLIADADEDTDLEELCYEIEADAYNSDLLKWLSSNLSRGGYCDEHLSESNDIFHAIAWGQLEEKQEVYNQVLQFLRDLADEMEDDDEEDE